MTPDTIEHEGKTLVRLLDINDRKNGDWLMISNKLYPVKPDRKIESLHYSEYRMFIQAAYREKKTQETVLLLQEKILLESFTKREQFAMAAMTAFLSNPNCLSDYPDVAQQSFKMADEIMLESHRSLS